MTRSRGDRTARATSGHALLAVTVLGVLAMAAWALGYAAVNDLVRGEARSLVVQRSGDDELKSLGIGLGLLETGLPPENPWSCVVDVGQGEFARKDVLTFAEVESGNEWTVDVRPATDEEAETLPPAPSTFQATFQEGG